MAARDVYAKVSQSQNWAYKTVKTMLARLVSKGALSYDQIGNSYLYRAAYDRSELTEAATTSFIQRVFDGALSPFIAHFADSISAEELAVLKQELRRIEVEQSDRKKKAE